MAKQRKPIPKSQYQISTEGVVPYSIEQGNPNPLPESDPRINQAGIPFNRSEKMSRKGDTYKEFTVGLEDIDTAIIYYFDNVIQPTVLENEDKIPVPVVYGSHERWKSIQKSGIYRDGDGKIQLPVIVYKRTSVEKRKDLGNKVDTMNPLYTSFQKKHSSKNTYDNFSVLTNRKPQIEFHNIVIPDYVKLSYDCIIFTEYLEQLNKVVEDINYAAGQYWGKQDSFKFLSSIISAS